MFKRPIAFTNTAWDFANDTLGHSRNYLHTPTPLPTPFPTAPPPPRKSATPVDQTKCLMIIGRKLVDIVTTMIWDSCLQIARAHSWTWSTLLHHTVMPFGEISTPEKGWLEQHKVMVVQRVVRGLLNIVRGFTCILTLTLICTTWMRVRGWVCGVGDGWGKGVRVGLGVV